MTDQNIKDYSKLTIDQGEEKIRNAISEAEKRIKQGREQLARVAGDVDKQVRDNPWPWIAGAAVGGLLVGLLVGKSKG